MANRIRETRLQMVAIGQIVPGVNDVRHSGNFNGDWSDTSSISSTASTASSRLQQRLRESTDIARSSLDSFRRESRESMDDMFRRGITASGEHWKRASTGEMTRSISQRLGFVKSNVLNKARRSGSVRSTASESSPSQHWLRANQYNSDIMPSSGADHQGQHLRSNSTNTNNSLFIPRGQQQWHQRAASASSSSSQEGSLSSSNMFSRFSQLMVTGQPPAGGQDTTEGVQTSSRATSDEDHEKLLFAKAAAARDQALYYRNATGYKGCV